MKEIEIFHEATNNVAALASTIKAKSRKIIGYMCSYAPEELIYAAGFHPMRLFHSKSEIVVAENHLQSYCCALVRGVLEDSLSGRLDFLEGAVFPHTCDTIQRLSDIWRMKGRYHFFADVILPVKLNTPSARTYMEAVLERFKNELETAGGNPITHGDLQNAIHTFNGIRRNLTEIAALKSENPGIIKGSDLYAIIKGAMMMDRDDVAALLPVISAKLQSKNLAPVQGKRLVISGSVCDAPDIYSAIEAAGGLIVGDDLCTGARWFEGEISTDIDPITAIAKRYMERMICPAKHRGANTRGENIVTLARKHKADGVIFLLQKFCDSHAFDYPHMKDFLEQHGIKNMRLEMEVEHQAAAQLTTRIETFVHMI